MQAGQSGNLISVHKGFGYIFPGNKNGTSPQPYTSFSLLDHATFSATITTTIHWKTCKFRFPLRLLKNFKETI